MDKVKAVFCNVNSLENKTIRQIWGAGRWQKINQLADIYPEALNKENFNQHLDIIKKAEVIFSCWGMPQFTPEQINTFASLKALFYSSGSVKGFAGDYLKRGIRVMSAWKANAIPVAEFTLAQILLSAKGYWLNIEQCKKSRDNGPDKAYRGAGIYNQIVALLGCGAIARQLIKLLKPFKLEVYVVDPYLSSEKAEELGVKIVSMEEAFQKANIISNHLPNFKNLHKMIDKELLNSMGKNAVFINTGRGAQLDHQALIEVLKERNDLTALLDVSFPEPLPSGSELYDLSNVKLSSHIAGSINNELVRMADYTIEDFLLWQKGEEMKNEVTLEELKHMA